MLKGTTPSRVEKWAIYCCVELVNGGGALGGLLVGDVWIFGCWDAFKDACKLTTVLQDLECRKAILVRGRAYM